MPTINLTDGFGLIVAVTPEDSTAFSKYLRDPAVIAAVLKNPTAIRDAAIGQIPPGTLSFGASFTQPVDLGPKDDNGVTLTINPTVEAIFGIDKDKTLFGDDSDPFGDPVIIPDQQAFVSFSIDAGLEVDATALSGILQFGFSPKTALIFTNYRLFPLSGQMTSAIQTLVQGFIIPATLDDVARMTPGSLAAVAGTGALQVSATANLLSGVNPLATVGAATSTEALGVQQGAALTVGATYTLSGGYQVRVARLDGSKFHLGFEKERGSAIGVTASADFGLAAGTAQFDLLHTLLQVISTDPVPDKSFFAQAGLSDNRIATIAAAIKTGVDRSLALAVEAELDSVNQTSTGFSYEIDISALDGLGRVAVQDALRGDLRAIEASSLPGVTPLKSVLSTLREGKQILRVNLLGIFNYASVSELFRQGTLVVDRETGDITLTDNVGANRVEFTTDNFAADPDKLRKVLTTSLLTTVAYRASKTVLEAPTLSSDYWFFNYNDQAKPADLADYLRTAEALALLAPADAAAKLQQVPPAAGRAVIFAESKYGDALFRSLFLDAAGKPRPPTEYEALGRQAMTLLVPPGSPVNNTRLRFLRDDAIWPDLAEGTGVLGPVLLDNGFTDADVLVVKPDFIVIRWWADAMSSMAGALAALLNFIGPRRALDVINDPAFQSRRKALDKALADVASTTKDEFGEPWGLVVMDLASGRKSSTSLRINSPSLSLVKSRA